MAISRRLVFGDFHPPRFGDFHPTPTGSYNDGYDDVYDNDDYDEDRYASDADYADGVDDAMEDADW